MAEEDSKSCARVPPAKKTSQLVKSILSSVTKTPEAVIPSVKVAFKFQMTPANAWFPKPRSNTASASIFHGIIKFLREIVANRDMDFASYHVFLLAALLLASVKATGTRRWLRSLSSRTGLLACLSAAPYSSPACASISRNCLCVRMSIACATSLRSRSYTKLLGIPSTWNSSFTSRPGSRRIG